MKYADIIAQEAESLPLEKQAEVLDFIAFLKVRRQSDETVSLASGTAGAIESLLRSFSVNTSQYQFNREDANTR